MKRRLQSVSLLILFVYLFLMVAGCGGSTQKATAPKETAPAVTSAAPASQSSTTTSTDKTDTATVTSTAEPVAQKVTTAPVQQKQKEQTVYVTKTGAKYHSDGCRYLSKSKIPMSLSDAKRSYTPCSVCDPPK